MGRRGRRHVKRVPARALNMVGIRHALLMITAVNSCQTLEKPDGACDITRPDGTVNAYDLFEQD
jgi:hypothetical protein